MASNPSSTAVSAAEGQNVSERLRELQHEAEALIGTLNRASGELGSSLRTELAERPYVALAAAAGVGYVLGGGFAAPLTRFLVLLGGRVGFEMLSREVGSRLMNGMNGTSAAPHADVAKEKRNGS